jgi:hypothetical protein
MQAAMLLRVFRAHDATNNFQKKSCLVLLLLAGSCACRLWQNRVAAGVATLARKISSTSQPYSFRQ